MVTALSSPVLASGDAEAGSSPGPGLTIAETVLLFVITPLVIVGVIWLAVVGASWARTPRYRPGMTWWADPVWVNGPRADVEIDIEPGHEPAALEQEVGGARARW
jgi:hypothetical protein